MAKGAESKEKIIAKVLETFNGAFQNGKELRIPMEENGEEVQIKITLTCAKVNVPHGGDPVIEDLSKVPTMEVSNPFEEVAGPSEEELQNLARLMDSL